MTAVGTNAGVWLRLQVSFNYNLDFSFFLRNKTLPVTIEKLPSAPVGNVHVTEISPVGDKWSSALLPGIPLPCLFLFLWAETRVANLMPSNGNHATKINRKEKPGPYSSKMQPTKFLISKCVCMRACVCCRHMDFTHM